MFETTMFETGFQLRGVARRDHPEPGQPRFFSCPLHRVRM